MVQIEFAHEGDEEPDSRPITTAWPTRTLTQGDVVVAAGMLMIAGLSVRTVHDVAGNSLVIEFVNGMLTIPQRERAACIAIKAGVYGRSPDIAPAMVQLRALVH